MLRFMTAGESHGKCLIGVLEGLPRGLAVNQESIDQQLRFRQLGYGRGGRMAIENDTVEITSGIRHGATLGSPISFVIKNKDWDNWQIAMAIDSASEAADRRPVSRPRPGHADLAGAIKYQTHDVRDILERASARETAARVAGGAFCRIFLEYFGIKIGSHVIAIGAERVGPDFEQLAPDRICAVNPELPVRCADDGAVKRMIALIDAAGRAGDTLGGCIEAIATGVPIGLGSHIQWDRRLDGRLAQAMMSIPSAKAVEIGDAIHSAQRPGSSVHDEIFFDPEKKAFVRKTNRAGGVEGGISNGSDLRIRVHLKPIPTLKKPLASVDVNSKEAFDAAVERGDVCVASAACVVAEAMLGLVLADAFLEKFGGDSIPEIERNFVEYAGLVRQY
jgi:chorismate synthase